jgi:hypothetical protein
MVVMPFYRYECSGHVNFVSMLTSVKCKTKTIVTTGTNLAFRLTMINASE